MRSTVAASDGRGSSFIGTQRRFAVSPAVASVGAQVAGRRAAATTGRLASTCSLLRVQAGRAPAAVIPRSERDPQLRPNWATVDMVRGSRVWTESWAPARNTLQMKSKLIERTLRNVLNELQMCICRVSSSLKANPKKIEKNIFRFCALLFKYCERALNSLFGAGLTFARSDDGQDLHPETPGRCRLGAGAVRDAARKADL